MSRRERAAIRALQNKLEALAWAEYKAGNSAGAVAYFAAASHARHLTDEPGQEIP